MTAAAASATAAAAAADDDDDDDDAMVHDGRSRAAQHSGVTAINDIR